jgi:uncharacterized membrane protein
MKAILKFLKTTLIGGLLIVLPVQLAIMLAGAGLKKISGMLAPLAALLPADRYVTATEKHIGAVIVLLILCFLAGLLVRTAMGKGAWNWFNKSALEKVPFFKMFNRMMRQMAHVEESTSFTPAVIQTPLDTRVLAWIVDEHPDGGYVVMIPNAPTPIVGEIHIVPRERVSKLNISIKEFMDVIEGCGTGSAELLSRE